jgi:hypothetical protein
MDQRLVGFSLVGGTSPEIFIGTDWSLQESADGSEIGEII